MIPAKLISLVAIAISALPETRLAQAAAQPRDYHFDGTISREVLENYLSRSISLEGLLNGRGDLDDNIRMWVSKRSTSGKWSS